MVNAKKHLRFGLQVKSVIILTCVVVGVAVSGGWFYFQAARISLRNSDYQHALILGRSLGLAAQHDLKDNNNVGLQRLVSDFMRNKNVRFVAILDARGNVMASASQDLARGRYNKLVTMPASVFYARQLNESTLIYANPVISRDILMWKDRMVGAVRLSLDTGGTTATLAKVRRRMIFIVVGIVICAIPLGYMLVWRVIIRPVREVASATRQLADGDYHVRVGFKRSDEIGDLSHAFDSMAHEIKQARDELVTANECLEKKVADRTVELRRANWRLRDQIAEKEDFLRAVSHDLNAPLRNIAGMTTMVAMKWRDQLPEEILARLQRIQANVDVGSSLIGDLLELSRVRSRPQRREVVDFAELMDKLSKTFEYELGSRSIMLSICGRMPKLYVEKNRMMQLFQNLLDNAIKYMDRPRTGRIDIGYDLVGDRHRFYVADNGPGIPEDQQQKIFYVFRRVESPEVSAKEGKGVGLALVKTIVSNYEGEAWVESVQGQGATFYISLDGRCTRPPTEEDENDQATEVQTADHIAG